MHLTHPLSINANTRLKTAGDLRGAQELCSAVTDAVSDYIRLRALKGLCPDVRKWGSPPGPAAFLDAGLPKTSGAASLPRGLSTLPVGTLQHNPCKTSSRESTRGRGRKESAGSIPSPTWEAEGPEGFVSQVLSFDEVEPMAADWRTETTDNTSYSGGSRGG